MKKNKNSSSIYTVKYLFFFCWWWTTFLNDIFTRSWKKKISLKVKKRRKKEEKKYLFFLRNCPPTCQWFFLKTLKRRGEFFSKFRLWPFKQTMSKFCNTKRILKMLQNSCTNPTCLTREYYRRQFLHDFWVC